MNKEFSQLDSVEARLLADLAVAEQKATDSLARYKFLMFGYWAGVWVHLNKISHAQQKNPWGDIVKLARERGKGKWSTTRTLTTLP